MQIQQSKHQGDGRVSRAIDDEQRAPVLSLDVAATAQQRGEEEFERVDVKQHEEQQHAVQKHRPGVLQSVAPEKTVVVEPDVHQNGKADAEGHKAAHHFGEFVKSFGDLKGNDQQGDGEGEDRVGESFQTRDLAAAPAEVFFSCEIVSRQVFADHRRLRRGLYEKAGQEALAAGKTSAYAAS